MAPGGEGRHGIIKFRIEHEEKILRTLIVDLHPSTAMKAEPKGLPALIIFMMIRYIDITNDKMKIRSILISVITYIQCIMQKKGLAIEVVILWLSNILQLLQIMQQHSRLAQKSNENRLDQRQHNFNSTDYHKILSDHAHWIYKILLKILEKDLHTVPLPVGVYAGSRNRAGAPGLNPGENRKPVDLLILKLENLYNLLSRFGFTSHVTRQIFHQLCHYVSVGALNNLMFRRDLWLTSKGDEIMDNIGAVEKWGKQKDLEQAVRQGLGKILQAGMILKGVDKQSKREVSLAVELVVVGFWFHFQKYYLLIKYI